jgi:hypothetical protein
LPLRNRWGHPDDDYDYDYDYDYDEGGACDASSFAAGRSS